MPVEPPTSPWTMPGASDLAGCGDLVAVGADLEPGTLLAAYRHGIFPMPVDVHDLDDDGTAHDDLEDRAHGDGANGDHEDRAHGDGANDDHDRDDHDRDDGTAHAGNIGDGHASSDARTELGWWSPDPRGVIPLDGLVVTRSMRRSMRRYEVRVDTAFADVVEACADPRREHGWITGEIRDAYVELHRLGWAHSIETWADEELVGGLYGVSVGGLFAGESMFSLRPDASKVALVALVDLLRADGDDRRLLDVQWCTEHLARLGAVELARPDYLRLLTSALAAPLPPFARRAPSAQ